MDLTAATPRWACCIPRCSLVNPPTRRMPMDMGIERAIAARIIMVSLERARITRSRRVSIPSHRLRARGIRGEARGMALRGRCAGH